MGRGATRRGCRCLLLAGAGFGAGYSQVITRSISDVPADQAHAASGLFNTINMLGFAPGVPRLGSAFLSAVDVPTPAETGSTFELVALGCGVLSLAGVAFVTALSRAEDRAHARGLNASSAARETPPVMAAATR